MYCYLIKATQKIFTIVIAFCLITTLSVAFQQKSFGFSAGKKIDLNEKLFACIKSKDILCVKTALDLGARPDAHTNDGTTILMHAIDQYHDDNIQIIDLLIDNTKFLNKQNQDGSTALMFAAQCNNALPIVEKLLNKGVDPNLERNDQVTALMLAAQSNNTPIIEMLLQKKADPNRQKKGDKATALMFAAQNNNLSMTRTLLEKGAKPNLAKEDGGTALIIAMQRTYYDIVEELIAYGAIPGKEQVRLFYNLRLFVEFYNIEKYGKNDDFKNTLKESKGHCAGLSMLWLYSKWASENNLKTYNNNWFLKTTNNLSQWNGKRDLSDREVKDFNDFLYLTTLFQDASYYDLAISQTDFAALLKESSLYTKNSEINEEYTIATTVTLNQLEELLNQIIHDSRLVLIISIEPRPHALAIYKTNNIYYFYDPNVSDGELPISSTKGLAKRIFSSFFFNFTHSLTNLFATGFTIYHFEKPSSPTVKAPINFEYKNVSVNNDNVFFWDTDSMCLIQDEFLPIHPQVHIEYPKQKDILSGLEVSISEKPLFPAAFIGCLESTNYFLHNNVSADAILSSSDATPLMLASMNGKLDVVKLYSKKANVNLKDKGGVTALMYATQCGFIDIVSELLKSVNG